MEDGSGDKSATADLGISPRVGLGGKAGKDENKAGDNAT
jgi:hypothetical protein